MSFLDDDTAAIEIPIRLVVYVILTSAIIVIAVIGFSNIQQGITADSIEKQLGEVKASIMSMQSGGARNLIDPDAPTGNIRTVKLHIPENIKYIAFGADPDPDNDGDLTNMPDGLSTERGNVIYYSGSGGKVRMVLDDFIEIREGKFENGRWVINNIGGKEYGAVIDEKGEYDLTFELVYDPISKEKYTLVHMTDELDAYINPRIPNILPNNLWISVNPSSIPADGVTNAEIIIKLKDAKGRDAAVDGVKINLSASYGNLSMTNLTTFKGKAVSEIKSDRIGTSLITATSPGLNQGSSYVTITPVPIILEFNSWLYNEDEELSTRFYTSQELTYRISFTGSGSSLSIPLMGKSWPNASIKIDGKKIGEETIDSESTITRTFMQATLSAGDHSLNISIRNDKFIPLLGDTNIFVEKIGLYG